MKTRIEKYKASRTMGSDEAFDFLLARGRVRLVRWSKGVPFLGWLITHSLDPGATLTGSLAVGSHPVDCPGRHPSVSYYFFQLDILADRPQLIEALQSVGYTWVSPDRFREDEPGAKALGDYFLDGMEMSLRYDGDPPETFEDLVQRERLAMQARGIDDLRGVGAFVRVLGPLALEAVE